MSPLAIALEAALPPLNLTSQTSLAGSGFVAMHILEERITGFTDFFNRDVLGSPMPNKPVGKLEATLKDQAGLFVVLAALLTISRWYPWALWLAVGFIVADSSQHIAYSIRFRRYTPGLLTVALYVGFAVYVFRNASASPNLIALAVGAGMLAFNFLLARLRA